MVLLIIVALNMLEMLMFCFCFFAAKHLHTIVVVQTSVPLITLYMFFLNLFNNKLSRRVEYSSIMQLFFLL